MDFAHDGLSTSAKHQSRIIPLRGTGVPSVSPVSGAPASKETLPLNELAAI